MRAYLAVGAAALAIAALGVWLLSPDPADPEEQVRRTLARAVEAAEAQDLGDLMELVSPRFNTPQLDRDQLKGVLFVQLRRSTWRRVFLVDTEIEIQGAADRARVRTGAVLTGGADVENVADVLPTDAASYRFDITLEREPPGKGDWRVTTASWKQAPLQGMIRVP